MELVLGVSVSGARADLALLDASNQETVLDQFFLELSADPVGELATTVIGTDRMLTDGGHRLLATRVCWSGREFGALKEALDEAGLHDTALLPAFATARDAAGTATDRVSDQSVTAQNNTVMAGLGPEMASSTGPLAPTALSPQLGPHLAYSQAADSSRSIPLLPGADYSDHPLPLQSAMSPLSRIGQYDEESDEPLGRPRVLLLGSAAAAVVVVGFSALAVTVAIGIRPTAAEKPVPVPNTTTGNKVYPIPGDDVWRPNPIGVPVGPSPAPSPQPAATPDVSDAPVSRGSDGGSSPGSGNANGAVDPPIAQPVGAPPVDPAAPAPNQPGWKGPTFQVQWPDVTINLNPPPPGPWRSRNPNPSPPDGESNGTTAAGTEGAAGSPQPAQGGAQTSSSPDSDSAKPTPPSPTEPTSPNPEPAAVDSSSSTSSPAPSATAHPSPTAPTTTVAPAAPADPTTVAPTTTTTVHPTTTTPKATAAPAPPPAPVSTAPAPASTPVAAPAAAESVPAAAPSVPAPAVPQLPKLPQLPPLQLPKVHVPNLGGGKPVAPTTTVVPSP